MSYTIRHYEAADEHEVVALWNRSLPRDEISLNIFRRKVILDANFDAGGCFVAAAKNRLVGFLLSIRRRYPYYDLGLEPGKGWVTVFFVASEWQRSGIATRMLQEAEGYLLSCGVTSVHVSDYTPNYFIPGVDLDAYEYGHHFLKAQGYEKRQNLYGMGRSLVDFSIPGEMSEVTTKLHEAGFRVSVFHPAYTLKLLEFLREHYPGDLFRVAHERLLENPESDDILLALRGEQVVGFSHFHDERFGPFGIHPDFTGRGLGPLLYYSTVEEMRKKGRQNLWLAWTTGRAKDFYHKVGLKVLRRHVIMEKSLQTDD